MTSHQATPPLEALLAHRAWVRSLARRLADNAVDADDLEQDAWLAAARARPHDGVGIRAWFAKVMRNRAAERHRLEVRRTTRETAVARPETTSGGSALVVDAESHARVVLAVLALDEPYRETVLLRFYEGLPPREVARRMGVPVDTVRTRLRRAAETLRAALGGERDDWLGALAPLIAVPHGAPSPVALVGGIAMKASTKVIAATVVLALAGAGWLAWKTTSNSAPPNRTTVATAPVAPPRDARKPSPRPSESRGGIDGTTTIARAPARAHVGAWRLGPPRDATRPGRGPLVTAGIRMSEIPAPAPANREADTDTAGAFAIDGLDAGAWRVVATFDDGRRVARVVDVAQARVRVTLNAPAGGCSLRGRAVHGDGRAFAGWVGVRQGEQQEADEAVWCLTGEGGAFSFAGLAPLGTRIFAADGATTFASVGGLTLPYDGEYLLVVDGDGAARRGRVVTAKDGSPVVGATVLLRGSRSGPPWVQRCFRATTAADGRFEFAWSGSAQFDAWADGYAAVSLQDDGAAGEVVLRLARMGSVAGRVLQADDGSPVAGAIVRVHPNAARGNDEDGLATSGADGTYRIDGVASGEASVYALGGGWVSRGFSGVTSGGFDPFVVRIEPDATATADLVVEKSARAEGRVVDAGGTPVAAASVSAWASMTYVQSSRTRTSADGAFAFDDLVPGIPITFGARRPDGVEKALDPLVARSGETLHVEIRLDPERRIDVTVLEEGTEAPIAGALISVGATPRHPSVGIRPQWATDAAGRADVGPVGAGKLGVRAAAHGFVSSQDDVVAEEIDETRLHAVVHLARGLPITGRVTAPDGVPIEGVAISAYSVVDSAAAMRGARTYGTAGWTRTDGSFLVEGVPDGAYVVRAGTSVGGRSWSASAQGVHPGDAPLTLRLASPDTSTDLVVRVIDAAGALVPEARVRFSLGSGNVGTSGGAPVRDGRALLSIPRGATAGWIAVDRPVVPSSAATPPGAVVVTVSFPDPPPAEFEVRLPAEKRITGRVIAPDGSGVRGVRVFALPTGRQFGSGPRDDAAHAVARTGADGGFDLGGLGDFTYELQFDLVPGLAGVPWTKVAAGTSGVEVRLSSGRELTLTVIDADGKPVRGCYVFVGGAATNAFTSADGVAKLTLDQTARGSCWLIVTPPDGRDDVLELRDYSWTPHDGEVRLERTFAVAGIVRDASGRAVADATVYAAGEAGFSKRVESASDGRFRVAGLRAGAVVRLRAVPAGAYDFALPAHPTVRATAGDTDVSLVLDASTSVCVRVEGLPQTGWTEFLVTVAPAAAATADAAPASTMSGGIVGRDGRVRLSGLDAAARNTFFVGPTADGLYGLVRDLAPRADEVVVRLVRGEALAGRIVAPDGVDVTQTAVTASGDGWAARTQPDSAGRFAFKGLPPGPCEVLAIVLRDNRPAVRGTARAATSAADVVVELAPVPTGR